MLVYKITLFSNILCSCSDDDEGSDCVDTCRRLVGGSISLLSNNYNISSHAFGNTSIRPDKLYHQFIYVAIDVRNQTFSQ